jgi:cell division protease FtsH
MQCLAFTVEWLSFSSEMCWQSAPPLRRNMSPCIERPELSIWISRLTRRPCLRHDERIGDHPRSGGQLSRRCPKTSGAGTLDAKVATMNRSKSIDNSNLESLAQTNVLEIGRSDVGVTRERVRQVRLRRLLVVLAGIAALLWLRLSFGDQLVPWPHVPQSAAPYVPIMAVCVLLGFIIVLPLVAAGRSPHVLYRPTEIGLSFTDVRGADEVVEEAVKTLNLFLGHRAFADQMGGTPRRGVLFEGPPGTGKTYLAKAMASEAGVPFLFVSSSAFQSMFYGQTNRKIRSFFRALRKFARREGGAIGFIEEIDAIGASRGKVHSGGEGIAGVVNELLIQLQSFDEPKGLVRLGGWLTDFVNGWLPTGSQVRRPTSGRPNVLVIGATNRAADLDPALLRPGRFDRTIHFDLPTRAGRRAILDYYLERKAHEPDLDRPERRDDFAAMTFGHSPVMIEHLLDEALVWALRRGAIQMSWEDLQRAKLTESLGIAQNSAYVESERQRIATHEAGHATIASLVGTPRKLEVLSIIKRRNALGLLAHSDTEERFVRPKSEIVGLIEIAFGGLVAEELFYGEASSGVASDLSAATEAACQMIGTFGMGSTLISSAALEMPGNPNLVSKVLSSEPWRDEVEALLHGAREHVTSVLDQNRHVVEALRDALLSKDELVGAEITDVIENARNTSDVERDTSTERKGVGRLSGVRSEQQTSANPHRDSISDS